MGLFDEVIPEIKHNNKTKTRSRNRAILCGTTWKVKVRVFKGNNIFDIDTKSIDIKYAKAIYSKPINNAHKPYTKHIRDTPINKNIEVISNVWGLFKPNLSITGSVINGVFVIHKSFYLDGYEYKT